MTDFAKLAMSAGDHKEGEQMRSICLSELYARIQARCPVGQVIPRSFPILALDMDQTLLHQVDQERFFIRPGVSEFLEWLAGRAVPVYLATLAKRECVMRRLENWPGLESITSGYLAREDWDPTSSPPHGDLPRKDAMWFTMQIMARFWYRQWSFWSDALEAALLADTEGRVDFLLWIVCNLMVVDDRRDVWNHRHFVGHFECVVPFYAELSFMIKEGERKQWQTTVQQWGQGDHLQCPLGRWVKSGRSSASPLAFRCRCSGEPELECRDPPSSDAECCWFRLPPLEEVPPEWTNATTDF